MVVKEQIQYGTSKISYDLEFAERKTLGIKVSPDKTVTVIAPIESSIEKVRAKVKTKASWILRQQDFFLSFHPLTPTRKYVSGETHLYLGRQYRLKILQSAANSVKLLGGYIIIEVPKGSDKKIVEKLLREWYRKKAIFHFEKLFKESLQAGTYTGKPTLHFRWMKKRWGSCSKDGKIYLNLELIKAPKKCIEYVIIHELCHLSHLNHSNAFYNLLSKVYPDWKITKDRLEKLMV